MKVFLRTYGCRANHYDSEQISAFLRANGAEMVASEVDADIGIFNSCSVTADAEADLRQGIRKAARRNSRIKSIVTGCAAGRVIESGEEDVLATLPGVSAVVGPADLDSLAAVMGLPRSTPAPKARVQGGARALLRIQDGCDEHCTFCVTTMARGNNRSRDEGEIIREAIQLAETHPEIVLTGTHIGSYGLDTGTSLGALVQALILSVPTVRFRLSSLEATEVDDRLLELFRAADGLVPYLHAPLQSGSDRLLRRMGRHWYTSRTYRERIEQVVGSAAVFGLGADVIAGFPGETDADHFDTVSLVEALPFTSLHVFPFSERPGTAATRMGDAVDPSLARERAAELRVIADAKLANYRVKRVEYPADVVVVRGKSGITEDFLSVLVETNVPRGSRIRGRLRIDEGQLSFS